MKALAIVLLAILIATPALGADLTVKWDPEPAATYFLIQMTDNMTITQGVVTSIVWGETRNAGNNTTFVWAGAPEGKMVFWRAASCNMTGCVWGTTKGAWFNSLFLLPEHMGGVGLQ